MRTQRIMAAAAATALAAGLAACSSGESDDGTVTVNWWTWDERQAASYEACVPGFEDAHPGVRVEISQYAVDDYFTKLTAGFVAGTAPDAFQNSVPLLGAYAGQGQIMALDDLIAESDYDLSVFDVGVDSWRYTDGKQYGIPLDWAGAAVYFNQAKVEEAGLTAEQVRTMTWNPEDGGTFDDVVSRLTVDENGVRGDEPGFDPDNVAVYGIGSLASGDFNGQTSWNPFVSTLGWRLGGDAAAWPERLPYDDPEFAQTLDYVRGLADRGLMPGFGQFTVSGIEQIGSGSVAMIQGGTWDAATVTQIPDVPVGIAPTVEGPEGRMMISNSNANNIFAGTAHPDETWDWVSWMGTVDCQTAAGVEGTFLPSISEALQATVDAQAEQGIDLSSFVQALDNGELYPAPPTVNGQEVVDTIQPMFEAYFTGERDEDVFAEMAAASEDILAP
ncbi:sugar ABC transporter substrate-binding protein [Glycomyces scopariae]|uniref:Carbohydrate ABC transporter substrate-binding protein, CUT1 family n=1 Tax=Glycomyces sambucus TaxID=380244 RepID=A0A1G9HXF6_9ACTN|nr:sugar ABC transporter substrate-binding protein [Glycomyces sambucus]SDL17648.1 carbohydrate ABC transporter substrate-binding protein, CUT1 family [Glycomyces sambucus]